MDPYQLSATAQNINAAINKALNPDTTPAQGSAALITSGGVKAAISSALTVVNREIAALETPVVFDYDDYKNNPGEALTLLQQAIVAKKPVYCRYVDENNSGFFLQYTGSYISYQWGTIHKDYSEDFVAVTGSMVTTLSLLHYSPEQSRPPSWSTVEYFHAQASLIFDLEPMSGSYNPVYSKGIYSALAVKAPLASPAFTGTPTAPTPTSGDSSTKIATTAFVQAELAVKAPLASPTFTGTPKAPTPTSGDDSTKIATTAFVQAALGGVKGIYPCTTSTTYAQITAALAAGKLPVLIGTEEGYTIAYVYSNGGPAGHQFVNAGWSEYFSEGDLVWGGLSVWMMICSSASVWTQKEVIPVIAAQNGTYTLKATKTSSGVTYSWVADA